MQQTDGLFQLVRSLTPAEKRYFKQYASIFKTDKTSANYVKLFDALNKWPGEKYDEKEFKRKNKGKAFIKNLADEKHYLRGVVLSILQLKNPLSLNPRIQIYQAKNEFHLLSQKGLIEQALATVARALLIAENYELALEACDLLKNLSILARSNDFEMDKLRVWDKKREEWIEKLVYEEKISVIQNKYMDKADHVAGTNQYDARELAAAAEAIIKQPFLTFNAKRMAARILMREADQQGHFGKAFKLAAWVLDEISNAPNFKELYMGHIRMVLADYFYAAHRFEQWDNIYNKLVFFVSLKTANYPSTAALDYYIFNYYWLQYLFYTQNRAGIKSELESMYPHLDKHVELLEMELKIEFLYAIAVAEFYCDKYEKSFERIKYLRSLAGRDFNIRAMGFKLRYAELIMQTAIGNFQILDGQLRSLIRFCNANKIKNQFVLLGVKLFRAIMLYGDLSSNKVTALNQALQATKFHTDYFELKLMHSKLLPVSGKAVSKTGINHARKAILA